MAKKAKKQVLIPFTPAGNLVTYPIEGIEQYEVAGNEKGVHYDDLVWRDAEEARIQVVATYEYSYTGRSRARTVLKLQGYGHIEILLDDFDEIMEKTRGLDGRKTVSLPFYFVKRGANFLGKIDWERL